MSENLPQPAPNTEERLDLPLKPEDSSWQPETHLEAADSMPDLPQPVDAPSPDRSERVEGVRAIIDQTPDAPLAEPKAEPAKKRDYSLPPLPPRRDHENIRNYRLLVVLRALAKLLGH